MFGKQLKLVGEQPHILNVFFLFSSLTYEVYWFWYADQKAFRCVCVCVCVCVCRYKDRRRK